jgi:tetratricopeptide (TPR) repeat protein
MDSRVALDVVGVIENTDKSSCVQVAWDYLRHYEALFAEFRHAPIKVVEIGVAGGRSLRMWKWFFTQAQLIGVDIVPGCRAHAQERVAIEIGSQDDPELLERLCADGAPTIVIDDGSHNDKHRIATFEYLFPRLAPGGIYVIEDFSVHVGAQAAADIAGQQNGPEYFIDIGRGCFAGGALKSAQGVPMECAALVDSTMFFANAVALRRKHASRDVAAALATADDYLPQRRRGAQAHENLAVYIMRNQGPIERAEAEVGKAIEAEGVTMSRLVLRAEILLARDKIDEARRTVGEAVTLSTTAPRVLLRLAKLQDGLGDLDGAIRSAEAAIALAPHVGFAKRALKQFIVKRNTP